MDYGQQPVSLLLRGPLLKTPQGWVVLTSIAVYVGIAVAIGVFGLTPPLRKSGDSIVTFCVFWPFITFLFFVRDGMPSFKASWIKALQVAMAAFAPIAYVVWQAYVA